MANRLDRYLEELRAGLAASKCRHASARIIEEAKAHLEEATEELIFRGITRDRAEKLAIERFGNAEAVCRWYAEVHRRPSMWRAARGPLAVIVVFALLQELLRFLPGPALIVFRLAHLNLFIVSMAIACFRAKRMVLPVLTGALGGVAFLSWLGFFWFAVPCPGEVGGYYPIARSSVASKLDQTRRDLDRERVLVGVLEQGSKVFASETPPVDLGIYRSPQGLFRTPIYFQMQSSPLLTAYVNGEEFGGETASWSEAKMFWAPQNVTEHERAEHLDVSPFVYVRSVVRDMRAHQKVLEELPKLTALPPKENARIFVPSALFLVAMPMIAATVGDLVGALLRFLSSLARRSNRLVRG